MQNAVGKKNLFVFTIPMELGKKNAEENVNGIVQNAVGKAGNSIRIDLRIFTHTHFPPDSLPLPHTHTHTHTHTRMIHLKS